MTRIRASDGTSLYVQDLGDGPPVVLISGFGLDGTLWDRQIRILSASGYRVVCIDQRGHGRSDKPLSGYAVTELADDLETVLDRLDLFEATLVGHSFGGQVAFAAAATSVRVGRLVLVGSNAVSAARTPTFPFGAPSDAVLPSLIDAEAENRISSRRATLVGAFATPPSDDLAAWLLATSLRMPSWAAIACYRSMLTTDLIHLLPKVRQPVLQVIGAADPVHSTKGALWLSRQLHDADLIELDACGHYPMLEMPATFETALLDFMRHTTATH
ncbi:alpha/beta fold hydrolase [Rhodococcus sp. T7]|uniref:alpha/beta fold hydrolase n=1 Tax=Rhodococcus sp. T7 TaxID=627444 RepID=UPI00135C64C1|nr:alpha/beta hydrolase [Rhodococcus sp. T7]KAF0957010.1 Arylesterase [Rhodococcus sp. T7]KAF0958715.1 Arylesterase [Rhodococcus sp. T7]